MLQEHEAAGKEMKFRYSVMASHVPHIFFRYKWYFYEFKAFSRYMLLRF